MKKIINFGICILLIISFNISSLSALSYNSDAMNKSYNLTKDIYYKLFDIWYIEKGEMDNLVKEAYDSIYNLNSNPEVVYNYALQYEQQQQELHKVSPQNEIYWKIKDGLHKLNTNWHIDKTKLDGLLSNYYAKIFKDKENLANVYNDYLILEKKLWDLNNNSDSNNNNNNNGSSTNSNVNNNSGNNEYYTKYKNQLWDRLKNFSLIKLQAIIEKIDILKTKYEKKVTSKAYIQLEAIRALIEEEITSRNIQDNNEINIDSILQ